MIKLESNLKKYLLNIADNPFIEVFDKFMQPLLNVQEMVSKEFPSFEFHVEPAVSPLKIWMISDMVDNLGMLCLSWAKPKIPECYWLARLILEKYEAYRNLAKKVNTNSEHQKLYNYSYLSIYSVFGNEVMNLDPITGLPLHMMVPYKNKDYPDNYISMQREELTSALKKTREKFYYVFKNSIISQTEDTKSVGSLPIDKVAQYKEKFINKIFIDNNQRKTFKILLNVNSHANILSNAFLLNSFKMEYGINIKSIDMLKFFFKNICIELSRLFKEISIEFKKEIQKEIEKMEKIDFDEELNNALRSLYKA